MARRASTRAARTQGRQDGPAVPSPLPAFVIPETEDWAKLTPFEIDMVRESCGLHCWHFFPILPPCTACRTGGVE